MIAPWRFRTAKGLKTGTGQDAAAKFLEQS